MFHSQARFFALAFAVLTLLGSMLMPLGQAQRHVCAEHLNGTLGMAAILTTPLGEV